MDILEEMQEIFRDIFDEEDLVISEDTTAEDIEDWDSLAQMNIMVALSKKFNIKFTVEEIAELKNVGDTVRCIKKKLG